MPIEERFLQHVRDSKKPRNKNRDLYKAFNTFGVECFSIKALGVFEEGELEKKEAEYIEAFNTFKNGYNQTLGGDGRRYLEIEDEEVIECYKKLGSAKKVSDFLGIHHKTALKILNSYNVNLKTSCCKPIMIVETGEVFDSVSECADYFIKQGFTTSTKRGRVVENISRVLRGERKSFLKFTFVFI